MKKHPWNYKDGKSINGYGYYQIAIGKNKHIPLHRIIMEEHLGRKLAPSELVHHKNGDKKDNRVENLEILTRQQHARLHRKEYIESLNRDELLKMINRMHMGRYGHGIKATKTEAQSRRVSKSR